MDLMTPAIFAVSPDTPVERVVKDMIGLHVHRLFVVDDDLRLRELVCSLVAGGRGILGLAHQTPACSLCRKNARQP